MRLVDLCSIRRCFYVCLVVAIGACADGAGPEMTGDGASGMPEDQAESLAETRDLLALLERRKSRVEDIRNIKRLQRTYGYYLDEGLWDELADLFSQEGSIEIGLDGVYDGKSRVREYLYALGGGRSGLAEGQLSEHFQLMPVITLAPDGMTARGRWRALIMAGNLGRDAVWGEGPYENAYVKEDGVWKLESVHWYQSVVVPYDGGWQVNADVNGGRWVSDVLPPDRPPSVEYETWPGTYLPPFHFPNPVLGAEIDDVADSIAVADFAHGGESPERLAEELAVLVQEVRLLEDQNAIEKLQRIYGFYIEEGFWTEAADLFADDGTIEVGNSGVYAGKDRVLAYLRTRGAEFPQPGRLMDRMQLQPVVHVAPDGRTARGRWHLFSQEAVHGEYARWGSGVYENDYVNEDGVWKIQALRVYNTMSTPYEDGWGKTGLPNTASPEGIPPDAPPTVPHETYPAVFVAPFHYENPVTGAPVYPEPVSMHAEPIAIEAIDAVLADLERRIGLLEDTEQLENLNAVYGYYLARNQWDDLAGIFSSDGTIEIAMRGVYVGPESVRRNLDLYGEAGIHHGLLHNHMQYQPVITVADDGSSAKMRSRAFSIMGQYETYSMWMGGIYENDYIKEDGIWKLQHDQVFNTYFTPYTVGWKDVAPRPPPGISDSNPPDLPPTQPFEMYPGVFVPPYHYDNPVTGNAVVWQAP